MQDTWYEKEMTRKEQCRWDDDGTYNYGKAHMQLKIKLRCRMLGDMPCHECIAREIAHEEGLNNCSEFINFSDVYHGRMKPEQVEAIFTKIEQKERQRSIEEKLRSGSIVYQTDGNNVYALRVKKVVYITDAVDFDASAVGESIFLSKAEADEKCRNTNAVR